VSTLDYYYNGKLDYENPRFHRPEVYLFLTQSTDDEAAPYKCRVIEIIRDNFSISCSSTPLGTLLIKGTFTDKRGQFWNFVESFQDIVLTATISSEKQKLSRHVEFMYWEGD
jgi:hypothetical protein